MEDKIKKMSNEYAENIMQAMDTIIQERLNKLSFDRTITSKVISRDEKDDNLYWVSTETMKFQARASGDQKYSRDEEVYVLIPEGNYNNEKVITGSRINNIEKAYNKLRYMSTKTNFVEHNILDLSGDIEINTNENSINNAIEVDYGTNKPFKYNLPIEQLGVSFKLDTLNLFKQEEPEQSGQYAISIEFFDDNGNELYKKINEVSEYTIYSTELTGNPYAFDENFTHFMLLPFTMENITQIQKIKIKFIQFNDFDNSNISIRLSDVQLHFGFEKGSENIGKSQLILPSGEDNIYRTNRYFDKTLYLQWIYGNKIYNYLNSPSLEDISIYEIDVFRYQDGYGNKGYYQDDTGETVDNINQKLWNWNRVVIDDNKSFEINIRLARPSMPYYNYKVIIRYKVKGEENWSYVEIPQFKFISNTNTQPPVTVSSSGLNFTFLPGDNGIYDFYSSNGRATDLSLINKTYQITVSLAEDDSDYSFWKEVKPTITWKYLENAMLIDVKQEDNVLSYRLASSRFQSNMKLECEVEYLYNSNKVKLNGQVVLQFGDFKSSGTNYSFNIHFDKISDDDLTIPTKLTPSEDGDIIKVTATLKKYVDINNYVNLDINTTNLKWEWVFPKKGEVWKCSEPDTLQILESKTVKYETNTYPEKGPSSLNIYLQYTENSVPEKNYGILKATLSDYELENGITTSFVDYLIIPIGLPEFNAITGPSELIYKSLSTEIEHLQTTKYGLYPLDNQGKYNNNIITWQLNNEDANDDHPEGWGGTGVNAKFKLFSFTEQFTNEEEKNETITRYSLNYPDYAPTTLPQVGIYVKAGSQNLWSQPILVIQNTWSNQWVNNWNGDLTLDEDNKVVAARSIVAGSKNGLNRFTGVKVGYAPGDQIEEFTGTGVYGYKNGVNMFRLTDQGELFIGNTTNNIIFNEDEGLVINSDLRVKADKIDIESNIFKLKADGSNYEMSFFRTARIDEISYNYTTSFYNGDPANSTACNILIQRQAVGDDQPIEYLFHVRPNGDFMAGKRSFIANSDGTVLIGEGKIKFDSTGGYIAGWTINSNFIQASKEVKNTDIKKNEDNEIINGLTTADLGTYKVFMGSSMFDDTPGNFWSPPVFGVQFKKSNDDISYPFMVRSSGDVYMDKGHATSWKVYEDKNFLNIIGTLGLINGNDGDGVTNNIGLETTQEDKSIILKSKRNILMQTAEKIYLSAVSGYNQIIVDYKGTTKLRGLRNNERGTGIYIYGTNEIDSKTGYYEIIIDGNQLKVASNN